MTGYEGKEVIGSLQNFAINKCGYGKASMIGRGGKRLQV